MKLKLLKFSCLLVVLCLIFILSFGCKSAESNKSAEETTVTETTAAETTAAQTTASETTTAEKLSGTIVIWKGPHADKERETKFNEVIDAFEKDNPGVKIDFVNTPWDSIVEKYTTAFASGNPPDIFYSFTGGYVDGVIDKCLDFKEIFTPEELAFITKGIPENLLAEFTVGGKLIGVPWTTIGNTLVYNEKMLSDAGFTSPPKTWDEQLEMCKKLTKDTNGDGKPEVYGYGQLSYDTAEAKPEYFLYEAGVTLFNDDMTGIGYDKDQAKAAFEYIDKLWNKEKVAVPIGLYPGTTMIDAFFDGKFAMWQCHSQINVAWKNHPDFKMAAAPMPAGPGTNLNEGKGTYSGSGAWSIAKDTKNLEAVKKFLMYFYDPKYLTTVLNNFGFTPSRTDLNMELDPFIKTMADSYLKYGITYKFGSQVNEVKEAVWDAIRSLQSGAISPEDAYKQAVENGKAAFE
ncbi:MAG: sugar ABC transporter substrate-binding protein [Cyanobacteria bacterium]|nr:sugar ABC transporter substrate-binding protein [Cyanobacteriota bacterium]